MTPEEYAAAQTAISAAVARYVLAFTKLFVQPALGITEWANLLTLLFPEIVLRRQQSADLARTFYDFQRGSAHPELPRNDQYLVEYPFEEFVHDMEPTRRRMSLEGAPEHAAGEVALRAVRNVENAGRTQIIHAVKFEPEERVLRGWARVATGKETCAWCLMLVSRGPVYYEAASSGLDLDDDTAIRLIASGSDVSEFMEEWHDGCDCKVIPVFKKEGWEQSPEGKAANAALKEWNDATKTAELLRKLDPDRVHLAGANKGKPFTLNELAQIELRRRFDAGELDPAAFAAIAA